MTKERLVRIVVAFVLVAGAILLKNRFPHAAAVLKPWTLALPPVVRVVGIVGIVLLAIVMLVLCWDRFIRLRKPRSYDEQLGRGTSTMMIAIVGVVLALLALGMLTGSRWIVMGIGICTIWISIMLVGGLIVEGVKALRKKRALRARPINRAGDASGGGPSKAD